MSYESKYNKRTALQAGLAAAAGLLASRSGSSFPFYRDFGTRSTRSNIKKGRGVRGKVGRGTKRTKRRKRFGKRKHGMKKRNATLTRKSLVRALAAPDYLTYETGSQHTIAATTASTKYCAYFTDSLIDHSSGSSVIYQDCPYGSRAPHVMQEIAYTINQNGQVNIYFEQTGFKKIHTLTNATNCVLRIDAYYMKARQDLANSFPNGYSSGGSGSIQDCCAWGLYTAGGTGGGPTYTNTEWTKDQYTPYNFNSMLTMFKIVKKKRAMLMPGRVCHFSVVDNRSYVIRPNMILGFTGSNVNYYGMNKLYRFMRGETFILFRASMDVLGNDKTTTTNLMQAGATINMFTRTQYEYKYIQDNQVINNTYTTGFNAPSTTVDIVSPFLATSVAQFSVANGV